MAAAKNNTATTGTENTAPSFTKYEEHDGIEQSGDGGNWTALKSVYPDGTSVPLVGWWLRSEPRTSPKYEDFVAGVVEITQPTIVVGADGKPYEQKEGKVSVTISVKKLEEFIEKFDDTEYIHKYQIKAMGRREQANGKTLQDYSVKLLASIKRSEYTAMKAAELQKLLTSGNHAPAQLTSGAAGEA